jgi:raffinose/stachyose/melibiose transport system permease protein
VREKSWWRYLVSLPILFLYLVPFYILIGVAFKHPADPASRWVMPGYLYLDNFRTALKGNIIMGMRDSFIITLSAVLLIVFIGAMAAYPLARNKTRLNKFVRLAILGVMMIPPLSIIVPLYRVMLFFNAISTYHGVVLLMLTFQLPLAIFLFTNFITSIPVALDEAAAIDGCGPFRTFFSVIMPQLRPVTVSVIILTGVTCWNDYQFSLYFLQSPRITSVTLAVSDFFAQVGSNVFAAAAAATLGVLPIVIVFLILQKYFIKGMVDSAIK